MRTRGPWATSLTWETVPINKHICAKESLWLCHNTTIPILRIEWLIIYKNLISLHTKIHYAKFGRNRSSGSAEDGFFKISSMYFCYFILISPWSFIWKNLNTLLQRTLCAKFGWYLPSGSGEDEENVKSLRRQRTNCDQKSSLELSTQVS